jgi:Tol biopolymer transport system component
LTHSPGNLSTEPDWSPNGRRIAYELRPRGDEERARILTIRANGHDRTSLGRSCTGLCRADGFPAWSPHGKRIAVQRSLGKRPLVAIFVMRANGTHARQITLKRADPGARQPFDDLAPA